MLRLFTILFLLLSMGATAQTLKWDTAHKPRLLPRADAKPIIKEKPPITLPKAPFYNPAAALPLIIDPSAFTQLDGFVNSCIAKRAFPGAQIVAMKDGVVIYDKSYGTYNYDAAQPVSNSTLYDIASVTKIAATTLAVMKLYEEGKINIQGRLSVYVPETRGTNKADIVLSDLLTHQAGLKAWIPFYKATLDGSGNLRPDLYGRDSSYRFSIPVAKNVWSSKSTIDTIWKTILESSLDAKGRYVYSDLDLIFMQKVVENVTGQPLDMYVRRSFYEPMGLQSILYNPGEKGFAARCAPTESDQTFRKQTVQGYVHDQGAAMFGGVAGHAGIFSTAEDLAGVMQMLVDSGTYKGKRYLKPETIALFTGYRSSISRRGYGFDKPDKQPGKGGPAASISGKRSFGHQGFTGTCAWADPTSGIVFVMLTNRVYPDAENQLINRLDVRTTAQAYIYKALGYK